MWLFGIAWCLLIRFFGEWRAELPRALCRSNRFARKMCRTTERKPASVDIDASALDACGPGNLMRARVHAQRQLRRLHTFVAVRKRPTYSSGWATISSRRYEFGLAGVFAGPAVARCALRWQVLHWRADDRSILPFDLSGTHVPGEKRSLLSECRGGGGSGFPAMPALPARMLAWNSGLVGNSKHSFARFAADQRERPGGWRRGSSCRTAGSGLAASSPAVPAASGRDASCGCANAPAALCQEAYRRNQAANEPGGAGIGLRLRAAV